MEYNYYLIRFGDSVREIRNNLGMSQVAFYNYLFPNNNKQEENIKKKMNKIENGKQKSLCLDFVLALCDKCNFSADYILGLYRDYSNYDYKFISEYTGLNEYAIHDLHRWCLASNNGSDIKKIDEAYIGDEGEFEHIKMFEKQEGLQYLNIINSLFKRTSDKDKSSDNNSYSHINILYYLYLLTMSYPERIKALQISNQMDFDDRTIQQNSFFEADPNFPMLMQDNNKVWYPFTPEVIYKQIIWDHLKNAIDSFVDFNKKAQK